MEDARGTATRSRSGRLQAEVLESPRFAGRIRVDGYGNAVFLHFDDQGLCGYELKNRNFTGFARDGEGLWLSHAEPEDGQLVLGEGGIDALSYAALHPTSRTRYASIGGSPNPKQPGLIRAERSCGCRPRPRGRSRRVP